jgi:uncharacterized protein (DUF433 family)
VPRRTTSRRQDDRRGILLSPPIRHHFLWETTAQWGITMPRPKIVCNPKVMMGKPVISGTRLTVEFILEALGAGETIGDLLASHPTLTLEGIQAALAFAAQVLKNEVVYSLEEKAA